MGRSLRRVRLVQLADHHLPALHRIVSDHEVGRYWETRGEVIDRRGLGDLLFGHCRLQVAITGIDGEVLGFCGLTEVAPTDLHGTITMFVAPRCWGLGHATEALVGYLDLVLATTPLRKLYLPMHAVVAARNQAVFRYLELEARLRDHVLIDGEWGDLLIASIRREDFEGLAQRPSLVRRVLAHAPAGAESR